MATKTRMPNIAFIVARSHPGHVIGCENRLPWRLPSDLKRFREITTGHAIVMGRKTFDSIGKALPGRTNIILSRDAERSGNNAGIAYDANTQVMWANSKEDALLFADFFSIAREKENLFIVGGEAIYDLFEPLVKRVYLTEVFAEISGDAYFRMKFPVKTWKTLVEEENPRSEKDEYAYRFVIFEHRERRQRYRFVKEFFTDKMSSDEWLSSQVQANARRIQQYAERVQEEFEY